MRADQTIDMLRVGLNNTLHGNLGDLELALTRFFGDGAIVMLSHDEQAKKAVFHVKNLPYIKGNEYDRTIEVQYRDNNGMYKVQITNINEL